jgi:hypothetical protein
MDLDFILELFARGSGVKKGCFEGMRFKSLAN